MIILIIRSLIIRILRSIPTIRIILPWSMRWTGRVARVKDKRNGFISRLKGKKKVA